MNNDATLQAANAIKIATEQLRQLQATLDIARGQVDDLLSLVESGHASHASSKAGEKVRNIIDSVAVEASIPVRHLIGRCREGALATLRHLTIYLVWERSELSYRALGKLMGCRDRGTITNSVRVAEDFMQNDKRFRAMYERFSRNLEPPIKTSK